MKIAIRLLQLAFFFPSLSASASPLLDQEQTNYIGSLTSSTTPGYSIWQSFTPSISGTLTSIDVAFIYAVNGDGLLSIYSGEGTDGPVLQQTQVSVVSFGSEILWNSWDFSVPSLAGMQYTFSFVPNPATIPEPYTVLVDGYNPLLNPSSDRLYAGGIMGVGTPEGSHETDLDMVFRTYVTPVPEPSCVGIWGLVLAGFMRRRH